VRHRDPSPPPRRRSRPPLLRGLIRQVRGRLLLGAAVILTVTGLMLTIPVVSGRSGRTSTVALEASSSATAPAAGHVRASSPVELGVDGAPAGSGAPDSSSAASSAATEGGGSSTGPAAGSSSASSASSASSVAPLPASKVPTTAGTATSGSSTSSSSSSSSFSSSSSSTGSAIAGSQPPSSPQPPSNAPSAPTPADGVGRLLDLINAQRAAAGCGALAVDDTLAAKAQEHSAAMRDRDYFGLTDPVDGSVLDEGARAAAIARGDSDAANVLAGWMADHDERSAILDCDLTTVGIGTADGDGGPWWTALLA